MFTTLNEIRHHSPCLNGWGKLLRYLGKTKADDELLSFATILESNGLADAIWCLRVLGDEHRSVIINFACDCAESVLHFYEEKFPGDLRPRNAIVIARQYSETQSKEGARAAEARAAEAVEKEKQIGFFRKYFCQELSEANKETRRVQKS